MLIKQNIEIRQEKVEASILNGYFGKKGLSEEEVRSALKIYAEDKKAKAEEKAQAFVNIQNENATLKAQLQQLHIDNEARDIASKLGVDSKTIPYLVKMADFKDAFNEDGTLKVEAMEASNNKVLEDIPALKGVQAEQTRL